MERILDDVSFAAGDVEGEQGPGTEYTVDAEMVRERTKGLLADVDLKKFVL